MKSVKFKICSERKMYFNKFFANIKSIFSADSIIIYRRRRFNAFRVIRKKNF